MNEQVQKSSSATEKAKNKLNKRLVKEASTKKSWKTILKQVFKVAFNTSAVAGIVSAGVVVATKTGIVSGDAKNNIAEIIREYHNPISEAMRDEDACDFDSFYPLKKWENDEELKKYCLTREQNKEANESFGRLMDKFYEVTKIDDTIDNRKAYEIFDKQDEAKKYADSLTGNCLHILPPSNRGNQVENYTHEDMLGFVKESNIINTCQEQNMAYQIYYLTGEKLPYYDRVNKQIVEEW